MLTFLGEEVSSDWKYAFASKGQQPKWACTSFNS